MNANLPEVGPPRPDTVPVNCVHVFGYPAVVKPSLTLTSTVVKSAAFVLAPFVLITRRRRSGNDGVVTVLVQNVTVLPLVSVTTGLIRNVLIALVPAPLLKFIAANCVPPCGGNTVDMLPKTPVVPIGALTFSACHEPEASVNAAPGDAWFGSGAVVGSPLSNASVNPPPPPGVHVGDGDGVGFTVGDGDGLGVGVGVGVAGGGVGDGPAPQLNF